MDFETDQSLKDWAKDKPLSILQLDPADRAVLRIADERDAIQKKTFTKWVNKHLKKSYTCLHFCQTVEYGPSCCPNLTANRHVNDLFVDLQDGLNLISLLEVLSGEHLHREKGNMRFHMLQNVELVLNFLRYKKIKLVNIRPEDIVDGNPKLTLGLIWTIILHFQIADIVVGEEPNVSAKDVLLRWAKRSTSKYPGVRVADFTQSWRDGLAFNAIIHRNRPDLVDWRQVRTRTVRERLETAFHSAEKVGVTRLLDPEDVDRLEIDEKSIITYISSLYDVFPEPPAVHPLYDTESQALVSEYREVSSTLHLWLREKLSTMSNRSLPGNLQELKRLSQESARFKTDEVPQRQRDKTKVQQIYRELQKYFEAVGEVDIEPELHVDILERNWNRLMVAHQERDQLIQEEIKKYERLQRLAEKVQRDSKRVDSRLDDLETRIQEESRRLERLHPLDAKANADAVESEMRSTEEAIQSLLQDVAALKSAAYPQASDLHKKVTKLHQRWVTLRSTLHSKLIARLASVSFPVVEERTVTRQSRTVVETRLVETDAHFRSLQQASDWCKAKLKEIQEGELGCDVPSVKSELARHQREHKDIDQFHSKVDHCVAAKSNFHGEELTLYTQHLNSLQKTYAEVLSLSNKRLSDLETLLDFFQSAAAQLAWLSEKEQVEVARDWSDKDLSVPSLEQYYESMMSQLEKREVSVRSVMERGESLLLQGHPGAKAVEAFLNLLQAEWAHVLQLTLALETHLKTTAHYQAFHRDLRELTAWIDSRDELLNTTYSTSEFTLDEGERLLKGMQELRDELNAKSAAFGELAATAQSVSPVRQRRLPVARPIPVHAVCNYKQHGVEIEKGDRWLLHDNSALTKWRVSSCSGGPDTNVPGVVFLVPPPDREALDSLDRLSRSYERTLALWQRKQLRMRQNMIFATIRVVRSWDLTQFVAMGSDQRNAIRRALNEDAEKLLSEGDPSDPQLRRLRREMEEVNRLFDEFERRARQEEESKNAVRQFNDQFSSLQAALDEAERTLNSRLSGAVPRDVHSLEHLVIQHKDFETTLKVLTPDVETLQSTFRTISRKTPAMQSSVDGVLKQWNGLWNSSHLYIERLKCVEILLSALDEASNVVSELEMKLATFGDMPSELEPLQNLHDDLIRLQNSIAGQQPVMDQLIEDATNTRRVVVKSRERLSRRDLSDLDRTDDDVNSITTRWNNLCTQLVERLRSCEAAYGLLENYGTTYQTEVTFIDEAYTKLNNLPPVTHAKHHIEPTKVLFTSIVERTQPLEQVNIDGGRFIREAKIHDSRRRRWLEETASRWQPSVDAVRRREPRRGEAEVSRELDDLNRRFLALAAVVKDRLGQIALAASDHDLLEFVKMMEPTQLKTFRTEFSLFEATTEIKTTYASTSSTEVDSMGNKINGESRTLMRKRRIEEGIGTEVIDLPGIVHPSGGQTLTVGEAIRSRILDVRTGRINVGGGESLSIREAVERGLVDPALADRLLGPSGIVPGDSLLEAIQKEILEAERGSPVERLKVGRASLLQKRVRIREERGRPLSVSDCVVQNLVRENGFYDRFTGEILPLEKAVRSGLVDPDVREVVDPSSDGKTTVAEALRAGRLGETDFVRAYKTGAIEKPMTLKDCVDLEIYDAGTVQSPVRKERLGIAEGIRRGVLDGDALKSVVDTRTGELITLNKALEEGIVLPEGRFVDKKSGEEFDVPTAVQKGLLTSVCVRSVFDVDGFKDENTGDYVSLNAALEKGILRDGEYVTDLRSGRTVELEAAAEAGLVRPEVFEMLKRKVGVMSAGKELSVFGAVAKGYLDPETGEILDRKRRPVPYDEAVSRKMISREGLAVLVSLLNITLTTQTVTKVVRGRRVTHLNYEEAVRTGLIDEETQTYVEPGSGKTVSVETALKEGLIRPSERVLTRTFELPSDGWYLKEAIERELFDPVTGMFIIRGTDRLVSFEECIKFEILNADSARVADPTRKRELSLSKGLEKKVLDPTGHYRSKDGRLTMKEAVDAGLVLLRDRKEDSGAPKKIQVTRVDGRPDLVEISGTEGFREIKDLALEPLKVSPGVIFDPSTALVICTESGSSVSLLEAVREGKVDEGKVTVRDPTTGASLGLREATEKGILDARTGEYSGGVSLAEAAKLGLVAVLGAPLVAVRKILEDEEEYRTLSTGCISLSEEDLPSLAERTRERVTTEPKYTVTLGVVRSFEQRAKPVVLQKVKKKVIRPKDAVVIGLLDARTAEMLEKPQTLEGLDSGRVTDPRTGEVVTIGEAVERGLVEGSSGKLLVPVARSLSVGALLEQGLIEGGRVVHPETGSALTLDEALLCEILDPDSTLRDPVTGQSLTLREALQRGVVSGETSTVRTEHGTVDLLTAVETGIFEKEPPRDSVLPPLGMTLSVALNRGLIDPKSQEVIHPVTGVRKPLEEAIKEDFLMTLPSGTSPGGLPLKEALNSDLIDPEKGLFRVPETGEELPVAEALDRGLLLLGPKKDETGVEGLLTQTVRVEKTLSIVEGAKKGLAMAVAAPILAGKAVYDAVKGSKKKGKAPAAVEVTLKGGKVPLKEAIARRIVDPDRARVGVRVGGETKEYTVREALDKGLVGPNTVVDTGNPERLSVEERKKVVFSRHTTPKDLSLRGAYDVRTGHFLDPKTSEAVPFSELVASSGLFDPESILVRDLNRSEVFLPLGAALDAGLIRPEDGSIRDPGTGRSVALFEALKLGWVVQTGGRSKRKPLLGLKEAVKTGVLDPVEVKVKNPDTGNPSTLAEAVVDGILDPDSILIRNPAGGELLPLEEAVDSGVVDLNRSFLSHPETKVKTELEDAFLQGYVRPEEKPLSLEAVIRQGLYAPKTGLLRDETTLQSVGLKESLDRGILDPVLSKCKDNEKDVLLSVDEALRTDLLTKNGKLRDTKTGRKMSLDIALQEGLIITETPTLSLIQAVNENYYLPQTGKFLDPKTGDGITLREALKTGLVDPKLTKIRDPRDDKIVSTENALKTVLDPEKGVFTYPVVMTLDVACAKGFVLPSKTPWTLSEALVQGCYTKGGKLTMDGTEMTLRECIDLGYVDVEAPTVRDPGSGDVLTLREALEKGMIDQESGKVLDTDLDEAARRGLILPAKRKVSLPEAVFKGLYDPRTGKFTDTKGKGRYETDRAIRKGLVDPASTMVKVDGKSMTFEHALEENIVDRKTGTVRSSDKRIDFQEAFEQGVLIEVRRPMSLRETLEKGVYDPSSGLFLDPKTGEYVTLSVAIESNIVDPDSVRVKDTKTGSWSRMSLAEAVSLGFVDGQTGRVTDFGKNEELSLSEAFEKGVMVDGSSVFSLQGAVHRGLYDRKTGRFTDPKTGERISLHEAFRRSLIDPSLPCYFDRKEGRLLSLAETCKSGIVDRRTGTFRKDSEEGTDLATAMEKGDILDIESCGFDLHDTLAMGLYRGGTFTRPDTGQKLTLKESLEDLIDPEISIVKDPEKEVYLKLPEALKSNIIDEERGLYVIPETEESLDLMEAKDRGYIAPSKRSLDVQEAVACYLFRPELGKFLDPRDNSLLDLQESFKTGFLTPDTTAYRDSTGRLKTLASAVREGLVDPATCVVKDGQEEMSLDAAFGKGVLVSVERPPSLGRIPVKEVPEEFTLEEAVKFEILDPSKAVVKDPRTGAFVLLEEALRFGLVDPKVKGTIPSGTSHLLNFEPGVTVFYKEPVAFSEAKERGWIDPETGRFKDPESGEESSLKDAVSRGSVDPDSVLVKDTSKRRLLKIPEAFKKGIVDDRGNVLDTADSKLYNVKVGLERGVLTTGSLSLVEALDYGLYNPTTGGLTDPFCTAGGVKDRRRMNLSEALVSGLVDPVSSVVRDNSTGRIATIQEASLAGVLDVEAGRFLESSTGKTIDLLKAKDRGYIIPAETRQAMEEKYKLCDDSLKQLLEWVGEVEDRLANQDVPREDLDRLRQQIDVLKLIKEELDSQQRTVSNCLDQVRVVVSTGSEYLTRDEVNGLERNGKSLRTRYERANERTDKLLRRLGAANEELSKFKTELNSFGQWMEKAERTLEERERSLTSLNRVESSDAATREFVSDVIAHQADLRFITMAAQKFFDESKEYLGVLNDFRTSLPSRLSHVEPASSSDSAVRSSVSGTTARYKDLLARANRLADRVSGVGGRQREYNQALDRFRQWFSTAEPRANKVISEPLAADPHALEEQLSRTKSLNTEFLSQGRLLDNLKQALEGLLRSVEGQISAVEASQLESPVKDVTSRYERLCSALSERSNSLDTALVQSQGVEDALDSVIAWLSSAENLLKGMSRPASLHKERLEEQVRELRVLVSDLESHRGSVESVSDQAKSLVGGATNPRLAKRIETKLRDVVSRFEKLSERSSKRSEFLSEISTSVSLFVSEASELERWLGESVETASEPSAAQPRVDDLLAQRDSRKEQVERVLREGRSLVAKKDVTDTSSTRDRIKSIESQWRELSSLLEEKQRLGKARLEQTAAYERLKEQVLGWLTSIEARLARLDPVAVHVDTIKKQADDLKPLMKEHRDYGPTIDKLFDLGNSLDSLARPESPTRRRSTASPVKRTSVAPLVRRTSHEGSPSPTKSGFSLTSPISPGGSSGFGSRRSSQEPFHLEELTAVQQELTEVNNRYSLVGVKLSDRQSEIEATREELRRALDSLKTLDSFLDKVQRALPRESLPPTKDDADKTNRVVKGILEEMYEKQSLLESTKGGVNELVRRKPTVVGAEALAEQLSDVASRWRSLNDACKNRIKLLEDVKDVHDTHQSLDAWLTSKDKMMTALGPISSDPRMVQTQIQQVQVLRDEFRAQQPQLSHLSEVGDSVLHRASEGPDSNRMRNKIAAVVERWKELSGRLESRGESLGAAVDSTREFDAGLGRLRDALQGISDQIDSLSQDKEAEEQLRRIQGCERQLEGVRSLLADAEAAGEELCRVLSDPASKVEIVGKLQAVNKQYNALQAKLDQRKAEIESTLRDGREFDASCARTLGWLTEELNSMTDRLLVSADREVLQQQLDNHEPIYKEVLSKEHEIIMLVDRGRERGGERQLDSMKQQWDRLKREAVDRHTRLQTCMEHCRKYYRCLETFIPWLSQAENKLDSLRPDSFTRRDVEKHLRDLSAFRNEVWKKSGEFEHLRSLGETFLGACDIDKEIVKQELAAIKARWDKLNNELMTRMSSLEEVARRLGELTEKLRDLGHSVQRCEDRLASHDSLGGAANDPAMLNTLKGVKEDAVSLRKPLGQLRQSGAELESDASELGLGRSALTQEAVALSERLDDLEARLDDRCSVMQSAASAVAQFNEKLKSLSVDLSSLESELDSMKPPGRETKTVLSQLDGLESFVSKLGPASDDVNDLLSVADRLVDSGLSRDATRRQAETAARALVALEERSRARQEELDSALARLQAFGELYDAAVNDVEHLSDELRRLKAVGSEVETIRCQQEEFGRLRETGVEPVARSVEEVNRTGQSLVQSAQAGVSTAQLERDLERINDQWNSLKEKLNERGRKLDVGLLQSGKFQEALEGLSKWLTDTEEMVANQRAPSADYKVVKAQLQEQKFLKKMLVDRQGSMTSLFAMGNEVAAGADAAERASIERQLSALITRFDALTQGASARMTALEEAMSVAKLFQERLTPVVEWLDRTEKKVRDMELVPTDEEKIQQRIREHDSLHNEILRKKPSLSELTDTGSQLMSLVGEDEASLVADRVQETAERYGRLVEASDALGGLLQASRAGLRHLVITYQQLQAWMEGMESRLARYRVLAVHTDKLLAQMEDLADLTEEIANHQTDVDSTVDSGLELMRHISGDEAIQLKDKLDSLQRRYNDLTTRGADLLKHTQEALPLVQQFHNAHNRLVDWMMGAESQLQVPEPREEDINRLEQDIQEFRPILENMNQIGPQLCGLSPGEGASTIEGLVSRDNRRFDAVAEQIQRKAERLHLSKQRSLEVLGDIDSLLEWFREVEAQLREAEPPSSDPTVIRLQLKEHKALNDDIASQKGRVRDVLSTAKKVVRESSLDGDASLMRDKMSDLREAMESVWTASGQRLSTLEEALGLSEHLVESHGDLVSWLSEMESQVRHLPLPAIKPDLIAHQQDRTEMLLQSISEHKPLVDKLNKTGEALVRLVADDEAAKVQEVVDSDNARYAALRHELKARQETLEKALQESSQFSDKLEGMLRALASTAEEVSGAEAVSAHVARIRQQQKENQALVDDLRKREEAFRAVRRAAQDVIGKAPDAMDPQVKDVKRKLERLNSLWEEVQAATRNRGSSLDEALSVAARFWAELRSVTATLADLEASLSSQEPPAVRPQLLDRQRRALEEIRAEMDTAKPEVEAVRGTGVALMALVGEPDRPEVRKHVEDLDTAWDTVTALFAKREENLINAMEKAMEFHETLQDLLAFLEKAEERFARLGALGSDINAVKQQIAELKSFKLEVDPHMVKVEALNRQAQELTERTSAEQAAGLKDSLTGVNARWDELHRGVAERNRQLENALLRLGQFHHALAELVAWIDATESSLDSDAARGVAGDPQVLEVELARLRVLANDVQAHRASVDTLDDAGRQLVEGSRGTAEASATQEKLNELNRRWKSLVDKTGTRQSELEEALKDAQRFAAEIQDLLSWLGEVDGVIAASKPVGGLPETATEQLERFMDVYNELEHNRAKVEAVLATGQEYTKRASGGSSQNLQSNLKTLKQRWDSVTARANDKRIKLEIALKEATEFHDALQSFVDWLTSAEKTLTNLRPVSRVLETILGQIEEHKSFQKEVGAHRETMIQLDKKGTHLKYFSQKQDVILIKNLLISVQHRWERVVSKSAERTRGLDHGYKEAKEFHDAWSSLVSWLDETERSLDEVALEIQQAANDPVKLKQRLARHRETQKQLASKQPQYDSTLRAGKTVRERAPKSDEAPLKAMLAQLKDKWNTVCAKAVDRQRKLEEALLYCGQFKDALEALLDWLKKTNKALGEETLVHGDLDTVNALVEQHKVLESELKSRSAQMESVERSGRELAGKSGADGQALREQLEELTALWSSTDRLAVSRSHKLQSALKEAEELHKAVHMLLEWLSDAEMKLRFVDNLPDDEFDTRNQIADHEKFMREMRDKEREKDTTISLAERILAKAHPDGVTVIKHWITIIQSRWEEVSAWARQRQTRLQDHLRSLQDLDTLLEELLAWLAALESTLASLEHEPLPKEIPVIKGLIEEHQEFMEKMAVRQTEVDTVCKAKQTKAPAEKERKPSGKKTSSAGKDDHRQSTQDLHELSRKPSLKSSRDNLGTIDRKTSRGSPGRDVTEGMVPHIGPRFPPKGSKAAEPSFRSPRARLLWDRWRGVWLMAWERQRRLQESLVDLEEQERLANFTWDDWRKRFLRFMNHKKSRLTDLFRKMDKNNDNLIPREDFVEGIVRTKFDTNRPEMGAVADMFDHHGEGVIDWKEFIAALRPDWEEKRPLTEAEKIHDEVKRLVMLCTCRQKFRVFQVGEGKYRFGDSQKLRLVRILRSTVMVRVGGGWVALDEFLVKNDPCRAKGRTNIELREQFILADGVSQSMSAFKPKPSSAGVASSGRSYSTSSSSQGPITKVRERSARSVPMARSSRTPGSADSLSDNEPSSPLQARTPSRRPRPSALTPGGSLPGSRNSSRPASRQGSKPPSRHGSTLSLASSDDGTPSRIPRRSVPARTSSGTTTPTTRKLTVPAVNGRSKSPSTVTKSTMQRASSIPTLGGSVSRSSSKIPVYIGTPNSSSLESQMSSCSSSSGGRTTPTGGKPTRRESTASESSRKTPTEPKAPFKL